MHLIDRTYKIPNCLQAKLTPPEAERLCEGLFKEVYHREEYEYEMKRNPRLPKVPNPRGDIWTKVSEFIVESNLLATLTEAENPTTSNGPGGVKDSESAVALIHQVDQGKFKRTEQSLEKKYEAMPEHWQRWGHPFRKPDGTKVRQVVLQTNKKTIYDEKCSVDAKNHVQDAIDKTRKNLTDQQDVVGFTWIVFDAQKDLSLIGYPSYPDIVIDLVALPEVKVLCSHAAEFVERKGDLKVTRSMIQAAFEWPMPSIRACYLSTQQTAMEKTTLPGKTSTETRAMMMSSLFFEARKL